MDGDVLRRASYGVYKSQLIRFARLSSHVSDVNTRNKLLAAKLLNEGYRYHKHRKAFFLNFIDVISIYIVSKFNVGFKSLLQQGLSELEFYDDYYINSEKYMLAMILALGFVQSFFDI